MKKYIFIALAGLVLVSSAALAAPDKSKPYTYKGKQYFVVSSEDPAMDSGKEVCAKHGGTCVGYTAFNNDICKYFNPSASSTTSVNGSKAGFYCNGAPQKGLACEKAVNNCQNCPNCNVNADCSTAIGQQFREMYVECSGVVVKVEPSWWDNLMKTISERLKKLFEALRDGLTRLVVKKVTVKVTGPNGVVTSAELPTDVVACEFYQTTKKLVTCGAIKAADTFCTTAMQSRFAKAALCQDNGVIICTNPCNPPEKQVPLKQCAFDNDRPRGKQAPPLDFCNQTIKVKPGATPGTKKPGQECAHGGECTTGYCLGQPSDQGIRYFCSCKPLVLEYTSCK